MGRLRFQGFRARDNVQLNPVQWIRRVHFSAVPAGPSPNTRTSAGAVAIGRAQSAAGANTTATAIAVWADIDAADRRDEAASWDRDGSGALCRKGGRRL